MHSGCLNCGLALNPAQRFCSNCGQSTQLHHITLGHIAHDGVHFVTHADKGIFSLIGQLAYRPGHLAKDYIEGQRKRYLNPLTFYLIVVGLMVATMGYLKTMDSSAATDAIREQIATLPDAVKKARMLAKLDRQDNVMSFMASNMKLITLLLATPLTALLTLLCYFRRKYNFAETLTLNFYIAGFNAMVMTVIMMPLNALVGTPSFYLISMGVYLLFETLYRAFALYQFYGPAHAGGIFRAVLTAFLATIVWVGLSGFGIGFYIKHGLWGWLG